METKKILVLAANPKDTMRLRLGKETAEIDAGLKRSKFRDRFILSYQFAVRIRDLRRALLDHSPHIVHFCGYGSDEGLIVEDESGKSIEVSASAISDLFKLFSDSIECVLLNACYSENQAIAISEHINYVIGMSKELEGDGAIEFAVAFYDALGAGKSYQHAFRFGCNAIQLHGIPGHLIPKFKERESSIASIGQGPKKIKSLILNSRNHPFQIHCIFSNNILLGRSPECDIPLVNASPKVSMWHARIQYYTNRNEYFLEDLDSTNGTYVQGVRIERKKTIKFGSKIQLSRALSFLFQHQNDDPLAIGCLIYFTEKGDELARYIIVPKSEVKIGANLYEHIKHPLFPEGGSFGKIINKDDCIFYINEKSDGSISRIELKDQMDLNIFSISFKVNICR